MAKKKRFSTFDVADMISVDPGSVANWIDSGVLKAHRTPGGHRRVDAEDLLRFLREHNMPIPAQLKDRPLRILLVDDERAMTQMLAKAIRAQFPDYEVVEAQDGFRAGAIVATQTPDVVILDLKMPGMDGFEVCKMIKAQEATRHAAVIAVTAYGSDETVERIMACGASACLDKPVDLNELFAQVGSSLAET